MLGLATTLHRGRPVSGATTLVSGVDLVRTIHDRLPVILAPADCSAWLDPDTKDADGLLWMLRPASPKP